MVVIKRIENRLCFWNIVFNIVLNVVLDFDDSDLIKNMLLRREVKLIFLISQNQGGSEFNVGRTFSFFLNKFGI